jgi:hypothetical protein
MEPTTPPPNDEPILQASDFSMEGYDKPVRRARITLFIIAGLVLISLYQVLPFNDDSARMIAAGIILLEAGIYVALALWTRKKPYTALIVGICFFGGTILLNAILQPVSIFYGIIIKIAIIVALIAGLSNARDCQRMMTAAKQL